VESREKAQRIIRAGEVRWRGRVVDQPSARIPWEELPFLTYTPLREVPVSRGACKLESVVDRIPLDVKGKECLDVGAGTGGFTEVLLKKGAKRVYAVDVGKNILHERIRNDPRVVVLEGVHFGKYSPEELGILADLGVMDVSFISVTYLLQNFYKALRKGGVGLVLVKPQFEVGKGKVGKGGVVRDPALWKEVVEKAKRKAEEIGFVVEGTFPAGIKGKKGNQEFFLYLKKP
jgi:23S rRNA (cytidine1920-2'-O)/16S rRNA (cytidine1409-2'-O)-methyltransferase